MTQPSSLSSRIASETPTVGRKRAAFVSLILSYAGLAFSIMKGIVLVPMYFRYFSVSAYGAWLASANIVALLGLIDLGFGTVFYQRLAEAYGAKDTARFARVAGCVLLVTLVTTPVFMLLGAAAAPFVPRLVNAEPGVRAALSTTFALTAAGSALELACTNIASTTHAWQRTAIGGFARLFMQVAEVVGTVSGLWAGFGVIAFGIGSLAGGATGAAFVSISAFRVWRQLGLPRPSFDRAELRDVVSATVPVFLNRIVGHVASNIDVALVSALLNPSIAAVYGLTDRLFRFAVSFVNPVAGSVLSGLAHLVGEVGTKGVARTLREVFAVWIAVASLCFPILLAMNRDFIAVWIGIDKYGGLLLSAAICVSMLFSARSFLMYIVLTGLGEIAVTSWLAMAESVVRIPLMAIGLRTLGPVGLPLATIVGTSVLSLVFYPKYVARRIELRGRAGYALQMTGATALIATMAFGAAVALFAPATDRWVFFLAKSVVVSLAVAAIAALASRDVRGLFQSVVRRIRMRLLPVN
jgi:O-antigen/teichoic acid export membrane protein